MKEIILKDIFLLQSLVEERKKKKNTHKGKLLYFLSAVSLYSRSHGTVRVITPVSSFLAALNFILSMDYSFKEALHFIEMNFCLCKVFISLCTVCAMQRAHPAIVRTQRWDVHHWGVPAGKLLEREESELLCNFFNDVASQKHCYGKRRAQHFAIIAVLMLDC